MTRESWKHILIADHSISHKLGLQQGDEVVIIGRVDVSRDGKTFIVADVVSILKKFDEVDARYSSINSIRLEKQILAEINRQRREEEEEEEEEED